MKTKDVILIIVLAAVVTGTWMVFRHYNKPTESVGQGQEHHDIYYCPMHPWIKNDKPGNCPICGMALILKHEHETPTTTIGIPGYVTVPVTVQKQQLIGLKTTLVSRSNAYKTIRAAGEYEGEVYAQIFENDLEYIKVGQKAIVDVPAYHQHYEGAVISIDSNVNEISRTTRVRIWLNLPNRKKLKSNMFVNVSMPVELNETILVPREAVMDTGVRKIVFVQKDEGTFEPRVIETGRETDDGFEVKSGLKEGERIVTSGNFLLDSESRVQASLGDGGDTHGQ